MLQPTQGSPAAATLASLGPNAAGPLRLEVTAFTPDAIRTARRLLATPSPPPPRATLPASCAATSGYAAKVLADMPWGFW